MSTTANVNGRLLRCSSCRRSVFTQQTANYNYAVLAAVLGSVLLFVILVLLLRPE
jgi:hypothetical protein